MWNAPFAVSTTPFIFVASQCKFMYGEEEETKLKPDHNLNIAEDFTLHLEEEESLRLELLTLSECEPQNNSLRPTEE